LSGVTRAALCADEIAESAEFFSFGTNDLTQTCFGLSRDDAGSFLGEYQKQGILAHDPLRRRIRALLRERRLGRGEPGDWHPVGRAGNVVEADLVAEADGGRIAAVLAADAELQVLARAAAALGADAHELAHPLAVDGDKGAISPICGPE